MVAGSHYLGHSAAQNHSPCMMVPEVEVAGCMTMRYTHQNSAVLVIDRVPGLVCHNWDSPLQSTQYLCHRVGWRHWDYSWVTGSLCLTTHIPCCCPSHSCHSLLMTDWLGVGEPRVLLLCAQSPQTTAQKHLVWAQPVLRQRRAAPLG